MSRTARVLGLSLTALLVMGVVMASAASAAIYKSVGDNYPTTAFGKQPAGALHEFVINSRTMKCPWASFSGTMSGPSSSTLTIFPVYEGPCEASGLLADIKVSGCVYRFHATSVTTSTVDVCPGGGNITAHVYTNKSNYEAKNPICTYTITNQEGKNNGLGGVSTQNTGSGQTAGINMTMNVDMSMNLEGSVLVCGVNGTRPLVYRGTVPFTGSFGGGSEGIKVE